MKTDQNYVLWFMNAVRELGGEYVPFRDFDEESKLHTSGRREIQAELIEVQFQRIEKKLASQS